MQKFKKAMFNINDIGIETFHSFEEVDGEPVEFPRFEDFEFFVSYTPISDFWGTFDNYTVTEVKSGCSCGGGFTKEEAIKKATDSLSRVSPDDFGLVIQKYIDQLPNVGDQ
jgi:hypothetical protein